VTLFDPATQAITPLVTNDLGPNQHLLYCAGHAALPSGKIVIRGGNLNGPGNTLVSFFDPLTNSFTLGPTEHWTFDYYTRTINQPTRRWYPTVTALGTAGGFLVMDGTSSPPTCPTPFTATQPIPTANSPTETRICPRDSSTLRVPGHGAHC
jgi:hypothetical protein